MSADDFLKPLLSKMELVKERRDFFVHKFLFIRYGGAILTSETEYENLIGEAVGLRDLFAASNTLFHDFMMQQAPIVMFAAKRDSETGELSFVESKFSLEKKAKDN